MTDNHTPEVRSYNMSRIRSKDTKPEMLVRKFLHAKGFRYRLHVNALPGKPDLVLKKHKTVIFINGCFWHGHQGCRYFVIPKSRTEFWINKINRNVQRENKATQQLKSLNWHVLTIWECELKKDKKDSTLNKLIHNIYQAQKV
ncbi:MAG: very short patch repair endonuclease [Adhaeribacter sp.]